MGDDDLQYRTRPTRKQDTLIVADAMTQAIAETLGTHDYNDMIAVLAARAKGERLGCAPHLASPMPASEGALQKNVCVDIAQGLSPRKGSGEGMKTPKP